MHEIERIMALAPVIPVVAIDDVNDGVTLAETLAQAGIGIIEVTLRTPNAVEVIEAIAKRVPTMCVGAGTVWNRADAKRVISAGAEFIVTPGRSDEVYEEAVAGNIPLLPGAQTVSEIALWAARGLHAVKFFPAEVAGGVSALKAFSSVFPQLSFCPTGGISAKTAPDYLALPAVKCVGGSWLVDKKAVKEGRWQVIADLAKEAAKFSAE